MLRNEELDDDDRDRGGDRPRVLLVEDVPEIRRFARAGLDRAGFAVDEAADGVTAFAFLDETRRVYVAIVTDIGLPDMSGLDVIARVRDTRPGIPVVVASGYGGADLPRDCVRVPKPYEPRMLADAVVRAVRP